MSMQARDAERTAYEDLTRTALDFAFLAAIHGPEHIYHDEWRDKYLTARAEWLATLNRASIERATENSLAAVHAALDAQEQSA